MHDHPAAPDRGLFTATPCRCVTRHNPLPYLIEQHHIFPKAYQMHLLGSVQHNETVPLCGTAHNIVHAILDATLNGQPPPRSNAYLRGLAAQGLAAIRAAGGGARDLDGPRDTQGQD